MATVTSMTVEKIQELMAGWESVGLSQEEINALVIRLRSTVESASLSLIEFQESVLPRLREDLAANASELSQLNDAVLPDLQRDLEQARAEVEDIKAVSLPNLRVDLDATIQNAVDRPKVYVSDDAPTSPDDDDRFLIVGDTWFDSSDDNKQRVWNGVEWTTFGIDIPDLSITVRKLKSGQHLIY